MSLTRTEQLLARAMSESSLQANVIALAQTLGYLVHAERLARTKDGWRTPVQGDVGFPDLVLAQNSRIYFIELKSEDGRITLAQDAWLLRLDAGGWVRAFVWHPCDWLDGTIERVLRGQV